MPDFLRARISHLWFLLRESAWAWILGVAWLVLGLLLVIGGRFFAVSWQQQTTIPFISGMSFGWWLGICVCLVFVAIIEGSYRTNTEAIVRIAELESRFVGRDQRRGIRDSLSALLIQGQSLLTRCENETSPPPDEQIRVWDKNVETSLQHSLEPSYIARYRATATLSKPLKETSGIRSDRHYDAWVTVRARMSRLGEFIQDFTGED